MSDEAFRGVKLFQQGRTIYIVTDINLTVPAEEGPANYVPAAAVIRRDLTLSGIIGCKGRVGGHVSQM